MTVLGRLLQFLLAVFALLTVGQFVMLLGSDTVGPGEKVALLVVAAACLWGCLALQRLAARASSAGVGAAATASSAPRCAEACYRPTALSTVRRIPPYGRLVEREVAHHEVDGVPRRARRVCATRPA